MPIASDSSRAVMRGWRATWLSTRAWLVKNVHSAIVHQYSNLINDLHLQVIAYGKYEEFIAILKSCYAHRNSPLYNIYNRTMQLFLLKWYFWLVIEKLKIGRSEPDCKVILFCHKKF